MLSVGGSTVSAPPSPSTPGHVLFRPPPLDHREQAVLTLVESVRRQLGQLLGEPSRWVDQLRRATLARNIQASNAIEGLHVDLDDAAAAVDGRPPATAAGGTWAAVTDYRDAMTYILQLAADPHFRHGDGLLRALHFLMTRHDLAATPGLYRTGSVYVWSSESGTRVYGGPAASAVPALVEELVDELNGQIEVPAVIRAGMAHLNLAMIHPFRDGNGRMARALQTLVLARDQAPWPELASIEEYLGANGPTYYRVLSQVGGPSWSPDGDTRPWIRFVLTAHHRQATLTLRRAREAEQLWHALDELTIDLRLDPRHVPSLHRAALGWRLDGATHATTAGVSRRQAASDLRRLSETGLLEAVDEPRGRRYGASGRLLQLRADLGSVDSPVPDPFEV